MLGHLLVVFRTSRCDFRNLCEKRCTKMGSRASGVRFKPVSRPFKKMTHEKIRKYAFGLDFWPFRSSRCHFRNLREKRCTKMGSRASGVPSKPVSQLFNKKTATHENSKNLLLGLFCCLSEALVVIFGIYAKNAAQKLGRERLGCDLGRFRGL